MILGKFTDTLFKYMRLTFQDKGYKKVESKKKLTFSIINPKYWDGEFYVVIKNIL